MAAHMSTVETARDLDIIGIRAVLGRAQLDYLGESYGTVLGARYADLFPGHVGRMVLDGPPPGHLVGRRGPPVGAGRLRRRRDFKRGAGRPSAVLYAGGSCGRTVSL